MLQLKVFYNLSAGDRCEVIMVEDETITDYESLLNFIRGRIESLCFIPDNELRAQYEDDEGTYVNLREESFTDALRCAKPIATFRRLKLRLTWQPKSTPELVFAKRREVRPNSGEFESKHTDNGDLSSSASAKKQLTYQTSDNRPAKENQKDQQTSSPPCKQLRPSVTSTVTSHAASALANSYQSPLELLIEDKEKELTVAKKKRDELQDEYESIATKFSKHLDVDYSKPSCTCCHRREGHNRTNCPFKGFPCKSAEFCGDINKHKDEKDVLTSAWNKLQAANNTLDKHMDNLSSKKALKAQVTHSFSQLIRLRLINECKQRYINSLGIENWRQINIDLKKLEAHFKGKVPATNVSLLESLREYDRKLQTAPTASSQGNPVRNLWELKGLNWPSAEKH